MEQLSLPVSDIHFWDDQPRPGASETPPIKSVEDQGVLVPILVRPHPRRSGQYECVAGERRLRSAILYKKEFIPAVVREMEDKEALLVAVLENEDREAMHPMDVAEGYSRMKEWGYRVEDIAEKSGLTTKAVYLMISLTRLSPECRKAFEENRFAKSSGYELAHYSWEDQDELLPHALKMGTQEFREKAKSYRRYLETVPPEFLQDPNPTTCQACPKRSSLRADLYAPERLRKRDRCLDGLCFEKKWVRFLASKEEALRAVYDEGYVHTISQGRNEKAELNRADYVITSRAKAVDEFDENSRIGLFIDGPRRGESVEIQRRLEKTSLEPPHSDTAMAVLEKMRDSTTARPNAFVHQIMVLEMWESMTPRDKEAIQEVFGEKVRWTGTEWGCPVVPEYYMAGFLVALALMKLGIVDGDDQPSLYAVDIAEAMGVTL